ncbi:hypothetical protein CUMW_139580 [Citrus unshiu]|uniref:RING-type domain-containing protein n=1 Tax=Citrus unshiu TaxID=55188 RepID=A0A2H5PIE5_CITUN|nr:hypothetical protein CUMW_139580 [Citrus unshiu]
MENEDQRKRQASRSSRVPTPSPPLTQLYQVSSDFAMAMALQEQERLATIESESSNEDDDGSEVNGANSYDYFECDGFDTFEAAGLQFLEGQDSNYSDDDDEIIDDDDELELDVDELTYEELIALGEFIGQEKRGLSLNQISTCLHACKSPPADGTKSGIDRCVICQVEYEEGESIVALLPSSM